MGRQWLGQNNLPANTPNLPSDKKARALDAAVIEGTAHSATLITLIPQGESQEGAKPNAGCARGESSNLKKGTQTAGGILPHGPMTQRIQRPILGIDWLNPNKVSGGRAQEPGNLAGKPRDPDLRTTATRSRNQQGGIGSTNPTQRLRKTNKKTTCKAEFKIQTSTPSIVIERRSLGIANDLTRTFSKQHGQRSLAGCTVS